MDPYRDTDPLVGLPVLAAGASAAYARAADPHHTSEERQHHLDEATSRLDRLGDAICVAHAEVDRLRADLLAHLEPGTCGMPWQACPRCLGVALTPLPSGTCCPSCDGTRTITAGPRCPSPATVLIRDVEAQERRMCLSHAAGALRAIHDLDIVIASRDERADLADVRRETSLIRATRTDLRTPATSGREQ